MPMPPHLLNGPRNDTKHFFQREFKDINEIMTTKYGDFSNKWWLWIGSTARAGISFKPSGICHAEIYLLSHSNWKVSRMGGVGRVEISVSQCWFLMLWLCLFQSLSLPLKPLISLFCSLHYTSGHSREMPGFLDSMANTVKKKKNSNNSAISLRDMSLPEGSPTRSKEYFVQFGGGAQNAELNKKTDSPPWSSLGTRRSETTHSDSPLQESEQKFK